MGAERTSKVRAAEAHEDAEESAEHAPSFSEAGLLIMQRSAGNRVTNAFVQAKLAVGAADDRYEREADAVADAVMRSLASRPTEGAAAVSGGTPVANIVPSARAGHDERRVTRAPISKIARSSATSAAAGPEGGDVEGSVESRIRSASGGRALDDGTRDRFESALGADLSSVRVHADSKLAPEIGAKAFTHGSDVHFAPGAYDPDAAPGQKLLAHELTHVVQQTGSARRVQAKLWDEKTFKDKTAIHSRLIGSDSSTAQDAILVLLREYQQGGFKPSEAIGKVNAMKDIAKRWIAHRGEVYADKSNYTLAKSAKQAAKKKEADDKKKAAAPESKNPKAERMAGLEAFIKLCDKEVDELAEKMGAVGRRKELVADKIDDSSDAYKKAKARYPDETDATSVFSKVGILAEKVVAEPGSSASLTVDASVPTPSGVNVDFGLKGAASKSTAGRVKLRLDVKVGVSGKIAGAAELSASLGGYLEAEGKSGSEAAALMSYALYRRGREGAAPTDLISMIWGSGLTGKAGLARSEAWSRKLESQIWGDEAGEDGTKAYVESGGTAAAKFAAGVDGVAKGQLIGGGFTGRRIDQQSLKDRKGGAGAQNVKSDAKIKGSKRQKRVSDDVEGWSVGGSASAAGFSLGFLVSKSARTTGGGVTGNKKATAWKDLAVKVYASGPMPAPAKLAEAIWAIAKKAQDKAKEAAKEKGDPVDASGKAAFAGVAKLGAAALASKIIPVPVNSTIKIELSSDNPEHFKLAISTDKVAKIPIPAVLSVKLQKTQTFLEIVEDKGTRTTWFFGQDESAAANNDKG